MNRYTARFFATCPNNGARIEYTLEITLPVGQMVMVERINEAVEPIRTGFHEAIADSLAMQLPGEHRLLAHHHGVAIETVRTGSGAFA